MRTAAENDDGSQLALSAEVTIAEIVNSASASAEQIALHDVHCATDHAIRSLFELARRLEFLTAALLQIQSELRQDMLSRSHAPEVH